jgi:hypothetical protein
LNELNILPGILQGKTVCDPTAGDGVFIIALVSQYVKSQGHIDPEVLKRIYLVEKEPCFLTQFQNLFFHKFGLHFPKENIINADIIQGNPGLRFDLIIGNPPWANFNDLQPLLKDALKPFFIKVGLVKSLKNVLLGGSRIDLAALVLFSVFSNNTNNGTRCGFFLPAALFLNDGASDSFRSYKIGNINFSLDQIYDFDDLNIFENVATRFCFATFTIGKITEYPILFGAITVG